MSSSEEDFTDEEIAILVKLAIEAEGTNHRPGDESGGRGHPAQCARRHRHSRIDRNTGLSSPGSASILHDPADLLRRHPFTELTSARHVRDGPTSCDTRRD